MPKIVGEMRKGQLRNGPGVRGLVLAAAVVLEAIAFATVLRPRHGYTGAHGLLVALALGVGVALGASIIAGAATAAARRRPRSLWAATTRVSTLGVVLALFIAAAVGSRIVLALRQHPQQQSVPSNPAARADLQRWQATVVPIVVRWMDAIRADRAFVHGLPTTAVRELRLRVARSQRTFGQLARALAADSPRLPQRPALRRLTSELATALATAERAQTSYALAIGSASHTGFARRGRATQIRLLVDRGNTETEQSTAIMYRFSLDANKLGASLFVAKP